VRTRRVSGWLLFVAFVVVPLVEIFVLVQVGQVIGAWWTILLLVVDSLVGTWLIKREGSKAWAALREALQTGRMPARELADGGLIVVGGTLMLTPGFVSDVLGIVLILPLTRPVARRALTTLVARRLLGAPGTGPGGPRGTASWGPGDARRPGPGPEGPVVRGEVVDDDD
jgi:UPF0716 protein FxsA